MTVTELAKIKNCTVHAVRYAIKRGLIKADRVGPIYVIDDSTIDNWSPSRNMQEVAIKMRAAKVRKNVQALVDELTADRRRFSYAVRTLNEREQIAILGRVDEGLPLPDIAKRLELESNQGADYVLQCAIKKIRAYLSA